MAPLLTHTAAVAAAAAAAAAAAVVVAALVAVACADVVGILQHLAECTLVAQEAVSVTNYCKSIQSYALHASVRAHVCVQWLHLQP
jgi:hypothetical protein